MSLIIFDMDGVIVDVGGSYREAARRTAAVLLGFLRNAKLLPEPLFSLEDVAFVKRSGGLNNDWDLTYKLIDLLGNVWRSDFKPLSTGDLKQIDAMPLAEYLAGHDNPLARLYDEHPEPTGMFAHFYVGDVGGGNLIKQIFQEIYLGAALFTETYNFSAGFVQEAGLIAGESLFLTPEWLAALAQKHVLAIATGRPRNEALYPLKKHRLEDFFQMLLSHDECEQAALDYFANTGKKYAFGKPDPFMLNTISDTVGANQNKRYFVGDMPDDMQAAKRTKEDFTAVGVTYAAKDGDTMAALLRKNKADVVCKSVRELKIFLLEKA